MIISDVVTQGQQQRAYCSAYGTILYSKSSPTQAHLSGTFPTNVHTYIDAPFAYRPIIRSISYQQAAVAAIWLL